MILPEAIQDRLHLVKRMSRLLLQAFLALSLFPNWAIAEKLLEGRVTKVRDVDTIVVAGTPVRLNGVDGPEVSTRAGKDAKYFMQRLVGGKHVRCELNGDRTHDRWVGVCFLDGVDVGATAIASGMALDCARYSGGRYRRLETQAARSKIVRARYC